MQSIMNTPVATKFVAALATLMLAALVVAGLGIRGVGDLNGQVAHVGEVATRVTAAGRATANLLSFARAVEFLPIEMGEDRRKAFEAAAEDEFRQLEVRLQEIGKSVLHPDTARHITDVRSALTQYKPVHQQVQVLSRDGKFDAAGTLVFDGARHIDAARAALRAIEAGYGDVQRAAIIDAAAESSSTRTQLISVSVVGIAASLALGIYISVALVGRPLKAITEALDRLAKGEIEIAVPTVARQDEVGRLAACLGHFRAAAQEKRTLEESQARAKEAAEAEKKRMLTELATNFESSVKTTVDAVARTSGDFRSTAQSVSEVASRAAEQTASVANAAESTSGSVQTVASAAEELSSSITEISRQVSQSTMIAAKARDEAQRTSGDVESLARAADKIGDVIKLISDIAGQTNLLALNATIEAARAGEAGKGFAVVASEVKNLASQTARATEDITQQIAAIQTATTTAVGAIKSIESTISEMNEIATAIASAVEEQGAATREIASSVQQAASGTGEVSNTIAGVTTSAAEAGAAAHKMLEATGDLARQAVQLRGDVERFLAEVRAAA